MHTKACLAHAIICAVENVRDYKGETNHDFRISAQDNYFLTLADEYLESGTASCICLPVRQTTAQSQAWDDAVWIFGGLNPKN